MVIVLLGEQPLGNGTYLHAFIPQFGTHAPRESGTYDIRVARSSLTSV